MKLLINADDFGLSKGQNYGIIDCFTYGVVRSTTLLATTPAFHHACDLAKKHPGLDIGVHLSLDLGEPVLPLTDIPSLIENEFFKHYPLEENYIQVNPQEVYLEWQAQIEKVIQQGINPSHIDSHHHIHMMKNIFPIYLKLAQEYQLAIRFHPRKWSKSYVDEIKPTLVDHHFADYFENRFYQNNLDSDFFRQLDYQENDVVEMMCHPAYVDQWILENSSYNLLRAKEAAVLQENNTRQVINEKKIQLITFKDLQ